MSGANDENLRGETGTVVLFLKVSQKEDYSLKTAVQKMEE